MNTLYSDAIALAGNILAKTSAFKDIEKIIFPPFPFINDVAILLQSQPGFYTGAQNCSSFEKGAFTGEVSAPMLKSIGANYVLIGHSERRAYFKEDAKTLSLKIEQAFQAGLNVVYCFGEALAERKSGVHQRIVKTQLQEILSVMPQDKISDLVLAYEPVWAIGTGETATPPQAQDMHAFVRNCLVELFNKEVAEQIPILYGGSCNARNARELFNCPDVDGGLIGGASLNADEFSEIVKSF